MEVRAGGSRLSPRHGLPLPDLPPPCCRCVLLFALSALLHSYPSFSFLPLSLSLVPPQASPCVPALPEPAAPTSSSAASLAGGINHVF